MTCIHLGIWQTEDLIKAHLRLIVHWLSSLIGPETLHEILSDKGGGRKASELCGRRRQGRRKRAVESATRQLPLPCVSRPPQLLFPLERGHFYFACVIFGKRIHLHALIRIPWKNAESEKMYAVHPSSRDPVWWETPKHPLDGVDAVLHQANEFFSVICRDYTFRFGKCC